MSFRQYANVRPNAVSLSFLIAAASRVDGSPKALLSSLETRPELARWILYTINSERFSLGVHVSSIRHAMLAVGHNTFRQLVLVSATLPLTI